MTEALPADRKICPNCGHANRATANVCAQCGRAFTLVRSTGLLRKRCPDCGHANRLRAKVCSQCGHTFSIPKPGRRSVTTAKWCPECGHKRNPGAKVCSNCGYHFDNRKSNTAAITQMPQPAVTPQPAPPQPIKLPPDLKGEPAPYISNDQLDQLRQGGAYHSNVFVRLLYQMTKKDAP